MTQHLRMHTAIAEEPSSIPRTQGSALKLPVTSAAGDLELLVSMVTGTHVHSDPSHISAYV